MLQHISKTFEHMCITVSRHGTCFWDGRQCATKCEKDGKVYVERVPGNELGFEHHTELEDMAILCFVSHCSLILLNLVVNGTEVGPTPHQPRTLSARLL